MPWEARVAQESLDWIEPVAQKAAGYFYGRLFASDPRLRELFPPAMDRQRDRMFRALIEIVGSLDDLAALDRTLARLGRCHRKFGVLPEHYPVMGAALIATLRRFGGTAWTAETETAWTAAYRSASRLMIAAAERDAALAPPWWVAEVTAHDRRAADLAVLTLRPDRPLPYEPGQYVPVQVRRWARVWRPYSPAGAPRPDGTLHLHVRAVPGGWVSGTLVRHTAPGDTVLLGSADGTMTLDGTGGRDLLLVAGGTGLAPLKAIAEQAATSARDRSVHLLVGARTQDGLYDIDSLRALAAAWPRLQVTPVVSGDPDHPGTRGSLPDVLGRFADPGRHEVYLAGPAGMVRAAAGVLSDLGVPPEHVHHDPIEPP
ncbi:globin domain-containing protein [Actinomadura sp. SCN-SB]|uniref:globin domain-containing protein n=1 Tax=Actinomadura sp. SCN-SB TaxID=3373092 RepID=UPI00374FEACF